MTELPVEKIKLAWFNPRECRDPDVLNALVESINKSGVLEPIHVVKTEDEYLCIEGGARLLAAKQLGLEEIPAKIYHVNLEDAMKLTGELQLTKDYLTPVAKGKFILMLIKKGIFRNVEEVSKYYAIPTQTIYDWIREYKARIVVDETTLPKPVAKELVTLPKELRKPIIQEIGQISTPALQKEIVKEVKREIKEKMVEEPKEVEKIIKKVVEKVVNPPNEIKFKAREFSYHILKSDQKITIMRLDKRETMIDQIVIPLSDVEILLKHLQDFIKEF